MFDKNKFSDILKKINDSYPNMTEFAKMAEFDRSYISKYIHIRLSSPPSPKILQRIADSSKGITTYDELMYMCGYTDKKPFGYGIIDRSISTIPLFISLNNKLEMYSDLIINKNIIEKR